MNLSVLQDIVPDLAVDSCFPAFDSLKSQKYRKIAKRLTIKTWFCEQWSITNRFARLRRVKRHFIDSNPAEGLKSLEKLQNAPNPGYHEWGYT